MVNTETSKHTSTNMESLQLDEFILGWLDIPVNHGLAVDEFQAHCQLVGPAKDVVSGVIIHLPVQDWVCA